MHVYTVSEFTRTLSHAIGRDTVAIEGEVTNYRGRQDNLVFFEIKDEEGRLTCFCLKHQLTVPLEDGAAVRVVGNPGIFIKNGGFHIKVRRIELLGEGLLKKAFEEIQKKLEAEGLFAPERKRPLNPFPEKIGIITSLDAAAYADTLRVLGNRRGGMEIIVAPVSVQGPGAVDDIVEAFGILNRHHQDIDAIILTRGGGSLEDLQAFNSEEVARAIFGSNIPVVTGIGHERDWTISDFVADQRGATPSNAAELVSRSREEGINIIESSSFAFHQSIESCFASARNILTDFSHSLERVTQEVRHELEGLQQAFLFQINTLALRVEKQQNTLSQTKHILASLHPKRVLERGYSITKVRGKVIRRKADVQKGDLVETQVTDGAFQSIAQ